MYIGPFQQQLQSFIITTNSTPSTSQSTLVTSSGLGAASVMPPHLRILNVGNTAVWMSFTQTSTAAVIPTAGTTTTGTPQGGTWAYPGIEFTIGITCGWVGAQFWINTISTAASMNVWFTPGEGM